MDKKETIKKIAKYLFIVLLSGGMICFFIFWGNYSEGLLIAAVFMLLGGMISFFVFLFMIVATSAWYKEKQAQKKQAKEEGRYEQWVSDKKKKMLTNMLIIGSGIFFVVIYLLCVYLWWIL